ncbi:YqaJ viral recombinase family protein [Bacteroidota bacterium]
MEFISTLELTKEQWLKERQNYITASGFASIIGANPYQTPYQYWLDKKSAIPILNEHTERMEIGLEIEDFIANYWAKKMGRRIQKDNKIRIHPKNRIMAVNIDRMILKDTENTPGYLECKNIDGYVYNGWEDDPQGGKKIPIYYYTQMMFGLAVTGWEWGRFAILVGGNHLIDMPIRRDNDFIKRIEDFSHEWWSKYMLEDKEPDKVVSDFKLSTDVKGQVEADPEYLLIHKMHLEVKDQLKKLKRRKEDIEESIYEKIGEYAEVVYLDQVIATWKSQSRLFVEQKKLQEEKPEIFNEYSKLSDFRVLYTKAIKEPEVEKSVKNNKKLKSEQSSEKTKNISKVEKEEKAA